ncbi:uncharacterized protein LOC111431291 isoform X1 [Cucurbita moschata]|uniref:Uncharacterized protein LOC111431291 isoform X1 n=1 Tax=Cucurbita moschata TaxID=3662 RepID=A0A6J1EA73_CUCMO|nr:uncharacterized protein LOC111431291 isoform X1 [Cucurbita moschata]
MDSLVRQELSPRSFLYRQQKIVDQLAMIDPIVNFRCVNFCSVKYHMGTSSSRSSILVRNELLFYIPWCKSLRLIDELDSEGAWKKELQIYAEQELQDQCF